MALWQKLSSGLGSVAYLLHGPLTNGLDSPERPLRPLLAGRQEQGDERRWWGNSRPQPVPPWESWNQGHRQGSSWCKLLKRWLFSLSVDHFLFQCVHSEMLETTSEKARKRLLVSIRVQWFPDRMKSYLASRFLHPGINRKCSGRRTKQEMTTEGYVWSPYK